MSSNFLSKLANVGNGSPRHPVRSERLSRPAGNGLGQADATLPLSSARRKLSAWQIVFLYLGMALLSGSLQRITGGELQGDMSLAEKSTDNYVIVIVGFAFYGWCGLLLATLGNSLRLSKRQWPLLGLVLLALASTIWSGAPSTTLARSVGLAGTTMFTVIAVTWCGLDKTLRAFVIFFAAWIAAGVVLAIAAPNFAYHSDSEYYAIHSGLFKGFYYHKNSFALVASLGVVALALAPKRLRLRPSLTIAAVGAGIVLLLLSGSAKTAFSVPAAIVAAMIMARLSLAPRVLIAVGIVLCAAFSYVYGFIAQASDYALSVVGRDPTLSARTDIWAAVIKFTFETNPLLGGGFGGGAWQKGAGTAVLNYVGFDPGHSHNGTVQIFAELGFAGVLVMLAYFAMVLSEAMRGDGGKNPYLKFVFGSVVLIVTNSFAASILMEANSLYWFTMCLLPYMLDVGRR